jgi:deoxyribodipyrimidine photo-lyase
MMLVDYDVSSNWANWQYVAGVGNDPRGDARTFNPVKQAFDYDKEGTYVRTWVTEVQKLEKLENVFQVWTTDAAELESCGLSENIMATQPVVKIEFYVDRKPRAARRPYNRRRGNARGGRWGGNFNNPYHSGSGASSETTANEQTGAAGPEGDIRDPSSHTSNQRHDSSWRGNHMGGQYMPGQPLIVHGHGGRGWHGGEQGRGRGNFGSFRGGWRPYGNRGAFRGRYPQANEMPYQQFPSAPQ